MNYPEELREKWNECMYDERDIIQRFLEKQYDIRYGRQRDTWHFEPAIEMIAHQGSHVLLHDIKLDKDKFVVFYVEASCEKSAIWECFDFAYGELSKVIDALPEPREINTNNALSDLKELTKNYNIKEILEQHQFTFGGRRVVDVEDMGDEGVKFDFGKYFTLNTDAAIRLRDYINKFILLDSEEYSSIFPFLNSQHNKSFEPANYGDLLFTIHGTDLEVDVIRVFLDSNNNLNMVVESDGEVIELSEKEIRPEYLTALSAYIDRTENIIDTYNGHNAELVRKINKAWKDGEYHGRFGDILFALARRDEEEIGQKFGDLNMAIQSPEEAMDYAHEIMEGVCDDMDLETILSFIRYEE